MDDSPQIFAGAGLTLHFDAETRAVIARCEVSEQASPISEAWLIERLDHEGFGSYRRLSAAINLLLASYNKGTSVDALRIAEVVDGSFSISLSEDAMEALLELNLPEGGQPVSSEMVLAHLADMGILAGIDQPVLAEAILAGSATSLVVARGRAPEHGEDGRLEVLLSMARSRAPRVSDNGQIDYRDLGEIVVVHAGDALMRRHPPGKGTDGRNLLGVSLPAREGKAVMFGANLPGTAISADDPDLLTAAITGQPVEMRGGMMVEPVFAVDAVSMASGNIEFDGTVVVRGDVASGMSVKATGDIEVGGVVEQATLDAGGSIAIRGGVIGGLGRKDVTAATSGLIRAARNIEAGYAQNARMEAGDCLVIDDTAMQCEFVAVNHILVGRKKRGGLVGGRHEATLSVTAKQIGSPQRIATVIDIGINPSMHKRLLELAKDRDGKETQLLEVSKLMALAKAQPDKLPAAIVDKAKQTATSLATAIAALREEQETLNQKLALAMGARVIAQQHIYEGVEVHLGERRFRIPSEFGACAVGLDKKANLALLVIDESDDDPSV